MATPLEVLGLSMATLRYVFLYALAFFPIVSDQLAQPHGLGKVGQREGTVNKVTRAGDSQIPHYVSSALS